jgi:hypothetical protein
LTFVYLSRSTMYFGHPNLLNLALLVRWSNHLGLNLSILRPKQLLMHIIMEAIVKHRIGTSHFRTIHVGVSIKTTHITIVIIAQKWGNPCSDGVSSLLMMLMMVGYDPNPL